MSSAAADDPGPWTEERPAAAPAPVAPAGVPAGASAVAGVEPSWPVPGVRAVLHGLRDAVVATDQGGVIRYVNAAAEELLGWPRGSLVGRPLVDLVPESLTVLVGDDFDAFVRSQAEELVGRRLPAVIKRADGSDVDTELVISIFDHPLAGRVVVGIFRPRDEHALQRWSELTSELLEILADVPIHPRRAALSALRRRLDWDVTTLWALSAKGELVCRHVWTRCGVSRRPSRRRAADPTSGSEGLPAGSWSTASRCGCPISRRTGAS